MGLPKAPLVIASVRGNHCALKGSKVFGEVCVYIFHCLSTKRGLTKTFSFTHVAGLPAS